MRKNCKIVSFSLYISPEGEVIESSKRETKLARKLAKIVEFEYKGGMIVLSTDVNVGISGIRNWARATYKKWYNRFTRSKKVDEAVKKKLKEEGMDSGWSIGNLFKGRYFSTKSNKQFDEKSFAVDIRGVPFQLVLKIAEELRKMFDQEGVLVVDYEDNRVMMVT